MTMKTWTASGARAKFYELIRRAEEGELQEIIRRGEQTFYVMRYEDWQSLKRGVVPKSLQDELKDKTSRAGSRTESAEGVAKLADAGKPVKVLDKQGTDDQTSLS